MKRVTCFIALVVILAGCHKELSELKDTDDMIKVELKLTGEVTVNEEPLTRASDRNGLLGIQVYQNGEPYAWGLFEYPFNSYGYNPYNENGIYDSIWIYMHSGAEYTCVGQLIKNGKDALRYFTSYDQNSTVASYILSGISSYYTGSMYSQQTLHWAYNSVSDGPRLARTDRITDDDYNASPNKYAYHNFSRVGYGGGYSVPFNINDNYNACPHNNDHEVWAIDYRSYSKPSVSCYVPDYCHFSEIDSQMSSFLDSDYYNIYNNKNKVYPTYTICPITNSFCYDDTGVMNVSDSHVAKDESFTGTMDRYYGESEAFTATYGSENTISIDMKHLVYGLRCDVTGVSDGTASITIKNGDVTLLEKTGIAGEYHSEDLLFDVADLHSAYLYPDNYTENVTVSMTWMRGVGVLQDLGSKVVQVKRNCMNVISVSLSTVFSSPALQVQSDLVEVQENVTTLINTYKNE